MGVPSFKCGQCGTILIEDTLYDESDQPYTTIFERDTVTQPEHSRRRCEIAQDARYYRAPAPRAVR